VQEAEEGADVFAFCATQSRRIETRVETIKEGWVQQAAVTLLPQAGQVFALVNMQVEFANSKSTNYTI
jgi:hypothetical protein